MEDRLGPVLRALPCALRGSSTDALPFNSLGGLTIPESLPPSVATALVPITEPCVLFRALDTTLRRIKPRGLLGQALYSAIRESLRSYLSLISELEVRVTVSKGEPHGQSAPQKKLTLASLQILLQSPTLYLRLFLSIVKQSMEDGANILSILYEYTQHGDPLIQSYAQELHDECYEPFKRLLHAWETYGSLSLDVHNEFFIKATDTDGNFELVEAKIPKPMTLAESYKILDRGRAVHFIRNICGDSAFDGLGRSFAEILDHTHHTLFVEHELWIHFRGLRDYMLLANGNFVDALFRNDASNFLMQPVSKVSSYMASEFFVSAIDDLCASNLENENTMKCVDAYILGLDNPEVTKKKQWRVWEAFIGKYHLDSKPLQLIVDRKAVSMYERCFASLWRIRLAIYSLTESSAKLRWLSRHRDVTALVEAHAIMNSGMLQAQQFLYYRVIDQGWMEFERAVCGKTQLTPAQIKNEHDTFLGKVIDACASGTRSRSIQGLAKVVLGLQRVLEDAETNESFDPSVHEDELVELLAAFNELLSSLAFE